MLDRLDPLDPAAPSTPADPMAPSTPLNPTTTAVPDDPAGAEVTLGARGLAALYAGIPVSTLRQAGLASGGTPADDAALDAAFAATPFMLDAF